MGIHLVSILLSVEGKIVVYLLNYSKGAIARPAWLKIFWKMSETVLSQSRIWDLEGLIQTQFTLELEPTTTTATLFFPYFLFVMPMRTQTKRSVCDFSLSPYFIYWWCDKISLRGKVTFTRAGDKWTLTGEVRVPPLQLLQPNAIDEGSVRGVAFFHPQSPRTIRDCCCFLLFFLRGLNHKFAPEVWNHFSWFLWISSWAQLFSLQRIGFSSWALWCN